MSDKKHTVRTIQEMNEVHHYELSARADKIMNRVVRMLRPLADEEIAGTKKV